MLVFFAVPHLRLFGKPLFLMNLPERQFTLLTYTFLPTDTVLFMLPHSETIAALRGAGLVVESLLELQPPEGATSTFRPHPDELAWARRWPMEEIWRARKP